MQKTFRNPFHKDLKRFPESFFIHCFYLFFTFQIFSPYISGVTLYLEYFFVFFNPFFLAWIFLRRFNKKMLVVFFCFIAMLGFNPEVAVKFFLILLGVLFIVYSIHKNKFYFYSYLSVSIFVGALQFVFYLYDREIALALGPESLSKLLWGGHATPTNTNYYPIFYFPRVSGLSREAGFFASLILASILLWILQKNKKEHNRWIGVGYFTSFSKMSLLLFPTWLMIKGKEVLRQLPSWFSIMFFLFFMIIFWSLNTEFLENNLSFLHRFGAYTVFSDITFQKLLTGIEINNINTLLAQEASKSYNNFAGLGGWILENGLLMFVLYVVALRATGINSAGFFCIFILTMNVQIDTNQNFVVLAYLVAWLLSKRDIKRYVGSR